MSVFQAKMNGKIGRSFLRDSPQFPGFFITKQAINFHFAIIWDFKRPNRRTSVKTRRLLHPVDNQRRVSKPNGIDFRKQNNACHSLLQRLQEAKWSRGGALLLIQRLQNGGNSGHTP
jgi:hypothetical protein